MSMCRAVPVHMQQQQLQHHPCQAAPSATITSQPLWSAGFAHRTSPRRPPGHQICFLHACCREREAREGQLARKEAEQDLQLR